jgi:predicted RNA-binding Zn ribbon-like protein
MPNDVAPGGLETVRVLLNTWQIPNETRAPTDRLPEFWNDPKLWKTRFTARRPRERRERELLLELRDDLRENLGRELDRRLLAKWLQRLPLIVAVGAGEQALVFAPPSGSGLAGETFAAVAEAAATGTWSRLKACGDCQWVFYDHTRNDNRRWCGMYAKDAQGRACGSIAKVQRYRKRQRLTR